MKRGEVWWAELAAPAGRRPVVILTRDNAIPLRTHMTVAPITRTVRHIPVEVPLDERDGLAKACVVSAESIVTIKKSQLLSLICELRTDKMAAVSRAVRYALALG